MSWYDWFSRSYDASLEALYSDARKEAANALELDTATRVLDLPVGTGQSLDAILSALPDSGTVVGVDLSSGMLDRAQKRSKTKGYESRVELIQSDVHEVSIENGFDRLHIFLGLTAFPDYEKAFLRLWDLLAPGGIAVVVDVHADPLGFQGRMVNLVARADIRRRAWEPLEKLSTHYSRKELPKNTKYGGALWLAKGRKEGGCAE